MAEINLSPCPFCGCKLSTYPQSMTIHHATSSAYVQWMRKNKIIVGSDSYQTVQCPHCGATGARGVTREAAIMLWNLRTGHMCGEENA